MTDRADRTEAGDRVERYERGFHDTNYRDRTRESQGYSYGSREYNSEADPDILPPYTDQHSREAEQPSQLYRRIAQRYPPGYSANTNAGPYTGRGPKGYRRSDERILEDVNDMLTRHGEIDASNIEVSVADGEVTLSGAVDSRRTKRLAEDIAEQARGVRDVHNRLRVQTDSVREPPRS